MLDQHKFQPLGSVKSVKADVRVIVATNKDLAGMVENGKFRQDLFYRIDVVHLELPPLRDRKEDIPLLVDKFIFRMNSLRGRAVTGMDREALGLLMSHDFPGNIRELENVIEHAFVLCSDGIIEQQHLPHSVIAKAASPSTDHPTLQDGLKSAEARAIMDALKRNSYNRLAAARDLGMHKSTLFRKIKKLGIILPQIDGRSSQGESGELPLND